MDFRESGYHCECVCVFTSFTARQVTAPGQVPLTHEHFGAHHLKAGVTLIGHHRAVNQVRVRCGLPAIGDLRKLWTGVVTGNLCKETFSHSVVGLS